jgi:hypothetical protein
MVKTKIIPSYVYIPSKMRHKLMYTVLKKGKGGRQTLKNFWTKSAAEKYAKK